MGKRPCAIVSFAVEGIESEVIEAWLREHGVSLNYSSGEYTLLDTIARGLPTMVRASPHYYYNEDEITRKAKLVTEIAYN